MNMKSFVYMFLRLLLADPTYISAFKDLLSTGFEKKTCTMSCVSPFGCLTCTVCIYLYSFLNVTCWNMLPAQRVSSLTPTLKKFLASSLGNVAQAPCWHFGDSVIITCHTCGDNYGGRASLYNLQKHLNGLKGKACYLCVELCVLQWWFVSCCEWLWFI